MILLSILNLVPCRSPTKKIAQARENMRRRDMNDGKRRKGKATARAVKQRRAWGGGRFCSAINENWQPLRTKLTHVNNKIQNRGLFCNGKNFTFPTIENLTNNWKSRVNILLLSDQTRCLIQRCIVFPLLSPLPLLIKPPSNKPSPLSEK